MRFSKITLFFNFYCLLAFIQPLHAQKEKEDNSQVYMYKKDWSTAANIDEAMYFTHVVKESDSVYIARSYNKNGPMIRQESFSDEDLSVPNGRFCWYNKNGNLDSTGWVVNGKKDNDWVYYRNDKTYLIMRYNLGKFANKSDYDAGIYTDADGNTIPLEEKRIKDSIEWNSVKHEQVEAKYKNGTKAWQNYISENLKTPDRLMNILGRGKYTDVVLFMINKEGDIDKDYFLMKSCEWSGDMEVLRIIKESPKWQAAKQDGKPVFYRQKQSITFEVN